MDSKIKLSGTRLIFLYIVVSFAYIIWGICGSLLPPFFPDEAKSKGASISQSGLVFGVFSLAGFISSPFFGKYGGIISPRFLYIPGSFAIAACTLVFGTLHYIDNLSIFLSFSYFLRIILGIANAAGWSSLLAAIITIFPDKVAKIVAASEFFYGIGYMLGPAVGALLYKLGGFVLPFEIIGFLALVVTIWMIMIIPPVNASTPEPNGNSRFGPISLMKIPGVLLSLLDTFFPSFGMGLIEAMMGLHLQSIGAAINTVSTGFFIFGGCYMASNVVCGYIGDKCSNPTLLAIAGNIGMIIAYLMIGPLPFLPIQPNIALAIIGMALFGFSMGMTYVSAFSRAEKSATKYGFPEDTKTYQLISGLWIAFDFMGKFLGPVIGGIAFEMLGFRYTTLIFWIPYLGMLIADIIETYYYNCGFYPKDIQYTKVNTFE